MITAIKKLLKKFISQTLEVESISHLSPPEIDFNDIEHNFSKRSYSFYYYKKKLLTENPRLLHWIGSIDYSGYQREKSLKYLIRNYKLGDENRILLRLEDWVDSIQELARKWILSNFNDLPIEQINKHHRLILYLSRKQKLFRDKAFKAINETLTTKASELKAYLFYQLDPKLRRYIYNLEGAHNLQFRHRILFDKDPFNRIILLKKFTLEELNPEELEKLKSDKSSFVKRNFLYFQINSQKIPSQEDLTRYSLDENKGIREIAKFYLQKSYGVDPYDIFKE